MSDLNTRICQYKLAMAMADRMLKDGGITVSDYRVVNRKIAHKYGLDPASIFYDKTTENCLIIRRSRGNM